MAALPQECPSCKRSLADPAVPDGYDKTLFSLAESGTAHDNRRRGKVVNVWRCPFCGHLWRRQASGQEVVTVHSTPNRAMRRGNKARGRVGRRR